MPRPFRFVVYAYGSSSRREWDESARRAEAQGYSALVMPDHFFNLLTPIPALAAAAAVTTTLRIGTIVLANDYRQPALLAKEAATLDLLSDGRLELGIGAGWSVDDYEQAGIPMESPGVRIERMAETLQILRGLWGDGPFDFQGKHYTIRQMDGMPKPLQQPHPPLFIGGTGRRMLQLAAREADIVGFLPQTRPHGGHEWAGSTYELLETQLGWVREAAGARFADLELSHVAFRAIVTDNRARVLEELAPAYGMTPEQLGESPEFQIGSVDQIVERLEEQRERFGLSHLEVNSAEATEFAPVVARLAGR